MFCKKCGAEINDEAVVCPKCGCAVKSVPATEEKKKANVFCIVGFVLAMVSLFITLYGIIAIGAIVFSAIGISQASRKGQRLKGLGIAGLVVGIISVIWAILAITVLSAVLAGVLI